MASGNRCFEECINVTCKEEVVSKDRSFENKTDIISNFENNEDVAGSNSTSQVISLNNDIDISMTDQDPTKLVTTIHAKKETLLNNTVSPSTSTPLSLTNATTRDTFTLRKPLLENRIIGSNTNDVGAYKVLKENNSESIIFPE